MSVDGFLQWFGGQDHAAQLRVIRGLDEKSRAMLMHDWPLWRRAEQNPPPGEWDCWMICAGRGFGKTRMGAEWVRECAAKYPHARIALVAASLNEARAVMVEGESGLLAICPDHYRPFYEPSLRRMTWPNGAMAFLYSASEPDSLRGPQHSHAWCDEIGKWSGPAGKAEAAWDNLLMGLRLGTHPQVVATTTPRATPLIRRLQAERDQGMAQITGGSTFDNAAHLPLRFITTIKRRYGNSALGRQELEGILLDDVDGALWTRSLLEQCREDSGHTGYTRIVVGVDPPASSHGDACGIIVCALDHNGIAHVLADCSVARASPERWARAVAQAAALWLADRVIAEANQGGAMVASVLRAADIALPVRLVHASRGKTARAEPIAALYEAGRVRHAGMFGPLEDQLCGMMTGGQYDGPGHSPDRADALVWALSELMLGKHAEPKIWQF